MPDEIKIAKLELKSGDVLVVKVDYPLNPDQVKSYKEIVKEFVPNNKIMILSGGVSLQILSLPDEDRATIKDRNGNVIKPGLNQLT